MKEITSIQNPLIKEVHSLQQKKNRNERGLFLIEGYKGVCEAIKSGLNIENIFVGESFDKDISDFDYEKIFRVSEQVMKKISTTDSPPEIIAVAKQIKFSLNDIFISENPIIVLLENIKDPGNFGTIIRTAAASEISGIILTDNSVDIYNPKTVRSSAANLWKIPIVTMSDKANIKKCLNNLKKCDFIATVVDKDSKLYYSIDFKKPTVIMFGSEAEGLSETLTEQADILATIPMSEKVESINLSISVGVMLYESLRQRKYSH
ncbi:MAG: RNA methyltransferase [Candidatus Gastranaerophilales bacterium]|nr:RNA methyltransferase [Candidatus Gastranaerophilales bacterium]